MLFLNYLIDNLDKYYPLIQHDIISKFVDNSGSITDFGCLHLYGPGISEIQKLCWAYHIINHINYNIKQKIKPIKISQFHDIREILDLSNNVEIGVTLGGTFREVNVMNITKSYCDKQIVTKYIKNIVMAKKISMSISDDYIVTKHIIIIRNFDKFSYETYMALRRIMEQYVDNMFIICISTNISNIPDAIKSRCLNIRCGQKSKKDDYNKLVILICNILCDYYNLHGQWNDKENSSNIKTLKKSLYKFVEQNNGDLFNILLFMENVDSDLQLSNISLDDDNDINMVDDYVNINNLIETCNTILSTITEQKSQLQKYIIKYFNSMQRIKDPTKILHNIRDMIHTITHLGYSNNYILEQFSNVMFQKHKQDKKKYNTKLMEKIIVLTANTNVKIASSKKEFYHYELYLLQLYQLFIVK
jgi:DNA polymerase III delta prime subunit